MAKSIVKSETFHVKIADPLRGRLRRFALQENRTLNNAIRRCIEIALQQVK